MELRPVLVAGEVTVRPGAAGEVERLRAILAEATVVRWWGPPPPVEEIHGDLLGDTGTVLLVVTVAGEVAGGIQYSEETDPRYRHAGIDIFLGDRFQDRGTGTAAVALLARFLVGARGHHRLTIDPAADNARAIRCYAKVGFRRVGILRQYEIGPDGVPHDGVLMDLLRDELAT
ncbi:GNAT family N-acetyltransferase [Frankia sp. AgKG'84/4]|uniref:GNAT family N-acetyltransferase n=1 Tax=Frankia sp. AgKG'84/4 TaxID=573490 RepID=UPI00200CECF7|nr:GNAT family protein [Frankia sp. AgKG'84/4]MCL9796847.1 GNAT family N-acetyltransferase [Frankia sp. AgKG'84/4]